MSNIDDGYIKYDRSHFTKTPSLEKEEYSSLEKWRRKLYELALIGEYLPEGIGYGNLSARYDYSEYRKTNHAQFCITGTQTGKYPHLSGDHYTRVIDYDFASLAVHTHGPLEASSESLTHASLYSASSDINAVFHIHSRTIWEQMIATGELTTHQDIPYGTLEMANAVKELGSKHSSGRFAMKGHEDGVVIYGTSLDSVGSDTLDLFNRYVCD